MFLLKRMAVIFLLCLVAIDIRSTVVDIKNQSDFDCITQMIESLIQSGESSIQINILPGTYFFSECHIFFENLDCKDVSISITSNDAVIVSSGDDYSNGDEYTNDFDFRNSFIGCSIEDEKRRFVPIDIMGNVQKSCGPVKVLDTDSGLCSLPTDYRCSSNSEKHKAIYILLSKWFTSSYYKVSEIKNGEIFFYANDLSYNTDYGDYNVNGDLFYSGDYPCFSVCNFDDMAEDIPIIADRHISFMSSVGSIHECKATRFLFFKNCNLKSLTLEGIEIYGNRDNNYFLIDCANLQSECVDISNCHFYGIRSRVARFLNCPNLSFCDNEIYHNYLDGLIVDGESPNAIISRNKFYDNGRSAANSFCIRCRSDKYIISNNIFVDYGYSGIGVGLSHYEKSGLKCSGIVEYNELCNSTLYDMKKNIRPMDSGAIYLYTQSDSIVIRYNYIHDILGRKDNRGVFCDDGSSGFSIYGNIITEIANSYCIDSRLVSSDRLVNKTLKTNVNNYIGENLIDGSVRFEYVSAVSNCKSGRSYSFETLQDWPYRKLMKSYLKEIQKGKK